MHQNLEKCWRSSELPGGSEFTRASEEPQNGGKMTGMDILEFRDINGPDPYNEIWFKKAKYGWGGNFAPLPPSSLE